MRKKVLTFLYLYDRIRMLIDNILILSIIYGDALVSTGLLKYTKHVVDVRVLPKRTLTNNKVR